MISFIEKMELIDLAKGEGLQSIPPLLQLGERNHVGQLVWGSTESDFVTM